MDSELRNNGERVRREVLGDAYVDRAKQQMDEFSGPLQDLLNEYCWGQIWTDEALDRKQRSILNLGMLAATGNMQEFSTHFRGAIRNGLTQAELRGALLQIAVYCGVPTGVEVFRAARKVYAEIASEDS